MLAAAILEVITLKLKVTLIILEKAKPEQIQEILQDLIEFVNFWQDLFTKEKKQ